VKSIFKLVHYWRSYNPQYNSLLFGPPCTVYIISWTGWKLSYYFVEEVSVQKRTSRAHMPIMLALL